MTAKDIKFRDEGRQRLMRGVDTLANCVRVTLGPGGRNVLLERSSGPPLSTKDGVTVAREVEVRDHFENIGAQMLREVASRTNDQAGDGTTTAIVIAQAIAREGVKAVCAGLDPMQLKRGIEIAAAAADRHIAQASRPVEGRESIVNVGLIASNGDREIADLLADAFERIGQDGALAVEEGQSIDTGIEVVEGLELNRGYISPHFVTDAEKGVCELEQPRVLLHEGRISALQPLLPILEAAASDGVPLLIIAEDVDGDALTTLVVNKMRSGLKVAAIKAPEFGDRRTAVMDDVAVLTGTSVIRETLGLKLESTRLEQLGQCRRVTLSRDRTMIVGTGLEKDKIAARVARLRTELEDADSTSERETLERRLASLSGGVALLTIGGTSEAVVKERKDRADDALSAVRAALAEGVVPGGGIALLAAVQALAPLVPMNHEQKVGINAVRGALEAPLRQIAENAGLAGSVIVGKLYHEKRPNHGLDARTGKTVGLFEAGIVDPARVVRTALRNGSSVASLLITAEAVIAEHVAAEGVAPESMATAG